MKKLCLVLLLFSYIAVMPSFAAKIIVNDSSNRIVPSRSSGADAFASYIDADYGYSNSGNGYQIQKYKSQYLPLLKEDIRLELVGTTWNYSEQQPQTQNNEIPIHLQQEYPNIQAQHREAADYFTKDTKNHDPHALIPCGQYH